MPDYNRSRVPKPQSRLFQKEPFSPAELPARRGRLPQPHWPPKEGDARTASRKDRVFDALLRRTVAAGVILGCCALLRLGGGDTYETVKSQYYSLLEQPLPTTIQAWNELLDSTGITAVFGHLEDAVMVFAGRQDPLPEEGDRGGSSSSRPETGQVSQPHKGAGGWLPWSKPKADEARAVPDGMTLARPILASRAYTPVAGRLTSAFGYRLHPTTGEDDFHTGIDIAAPLGTPIKAAWPGMVTEVGSSSIYGNYIVLQHSAGLSTVYCHCDSILAREGMILRAGERIATVGATGIVTGPHLHFDLVVDGLRADPLAAFDLP